MDSKVRYQINNDNTVSEIHKIVVHRITYTSHTRYNTEESDRYQIIQDWAETDAGNFVCKYAITCPTLLSHQDVSTYQRKFSIIAELEKKKLSEFYLKWGSTLGNN